MNRFEYQRYWSIPPILNVGSKEDPANLSMYESTVNVDIKLEDEQQGGPLTVPNLIQADATRLPFRDKSFNTVVAAELLEHMYEVEMWEAINEFTRVAKQRMVITSPRDDRVGTIHADPFHKMRLMRRQLEVAFLGPLSIHGWSILDWTEGELYDLDPIGPCHGYWITLARYE